MTNGHLLEKSTQDSYFKDTQTRKDSRTGLLARVYLMILSWPEETVAENNQNIEDGKAELRIESA